MPSRRLHCSNDASDERGLPVSEQFATDPDDCPAQIEQCAVPVDVSVALLTVRPVLRSVVLNTDPQILVTHIDSGNEASVFVEYPDLRLRSRQARGAHNQPGLSPRGNLRPPRA